MTKINISKISRLRTFTDGEGVSTLIGCMGCPLRCAYCFNPFSWDKSLKPKKYTIDELYDEVKRDNIYFLATGGGLVFGGGEPLLHHKFIKEFIKKYKSTGWKFTLETSLSTKQEFLADLIDYIDYFIVDTKDMDKNRYELYTNGNYELFISNLKYLLNSVGSDRITVRVPKIPKLNDDAQVKSNYIILKNMGFNNIDVFDYVDLDNYDKISSLALRNKEDFNERLNLNDITDYIISEIVLKFPPILDFHVNKFPESFVKNTEFVFTYDSSYDDLDFIKKVIISKLQKCYEDNALRYKFFVVLYPMNHLKKDSLEFNDSEINDDVALRLWKQDKYSYLKFKNLTKSEFYINHDNYHPNLESKYILSNPYDVIESEYMVKIHIKKVGNNFIIVEHEDATHALIQKFNNEMELISQKIDLIYD